jgi:hypothetical protein
MEPISLNTTSSENPIILKGNNKSHSKGNRKISAKAKGQHITNKIHQSKMAIIDLIGFCLVPYALQNKRQSHEVLNYGLNHHRSIQAIVNR